MAPPHPQHSSRFGAALRFVRGVSRGLRMGAFFPHDGRTPGAAAPGGSHSHRHPVSRRTRSGTTAWTCTEHRVPIRGLAESVHILHLSDVHLRGPAPWVTLLCEALRTEQADLVLLTGDLVARGWEEATVRAFLAALPEARLGRYAILGNWEHWSDVRADPWRRLLGEHGVRLLVDEVAPAGPVDIAGTDDLLAGSPDLARLGSRLLAGRPKVVLTHSPAMFPALAGPAVDLVLSGHSHGGQVRIPGLGALWVPRGTGGYVAGWYQQDGSWMYVHSGVGWSIAPLRLGCPPELARIELVPE